MPRTKWLDGLRGIAAAIVAFDHLFMSDIWHPFISYWADPPEANRHILQLPPFRILFSAQGMVTLFMIISGYAISISLLKARNTGQFLDRVSSAIIRRIFRIYLPVLVTASLAQVLYFFNLFTWNFEEDFLATLPKPWSNPWAHIRYIFGFMANCINIIAFQYRGSLNGQLWTMPYEFRGSNVVYLLIIGLSTWRVRARLTMLPLMASFFLWYGNWDIFGFIWGLWLAERANPPSPSLDENPDSEFDMAEFHDEERITSNQLSTLPLTFNTSTKNWYTSFTARNHLTLSRITISLSFTAGYYLLCLGLDGHLPAGYAFLNSLQPAHWGENWDISHMSIKSVGSALLVFAISQSPLLQQPLNTRPIQYLGKISFALYLLHETVYQLFRNPLRDTLFKVLSGREYGDSSLALGTDVWAFHVAWWITGMVLGCMVVGAAHYYTIYIDNRCVALAKRIDVWFRS